MTVSFLSPAYTEEPPAETHGTESGWPEVHRGLRLILMGHLVLIGGIIAFVWLFVSLSQINKGMRAGAGGKIDWGEIAIFVGLAILGFVFLASYWMILVGQWRCAKAPERCGAKWFIFTCLTCIIVVPLLNLASSFLGGSENYMLVKKGMDGVAQVRIATTGEYLQLVGAIISFVSFVAFTLFLRAVTVCFNDRNRQLNVDIYLFFTGVITIVGFYLSWTQPERFLEAAKMAQAGRGRQAPRLDPVLLGLVGASLISAVWFLCLIASVSRCIANGLAQYRSPLAVPK